MTVSLMDFWLKGTIVYSIKFKKLRHNCRDVYFFYIVEMYV
jgi:hypothetical protein